MSTSQLGGALITPVEYNKIWYGDLDDLFREHLGLVLRGDRLPDGTYAWDDYDFEWSDVLMNFGQDSFTIIEPSDVELSEEDENKLEVYIQKLFKLGILPTDRPLFIDIWW